MKSYALLDGVLGVMRKARAHDVGQLVGLHLPGLVLIAVIAIAGHFLSSRLGGSAFLYALLLGLLCHPLARQPDTEVSVNTATRWFLPAGIALMGLQITFTDLQLLGWKVFALVALIVFVSLLLGYCLARLFGLGAGHSILSAAAVSICGASAAAAIFSALPATRRSDSQLTATITGVTMLSALAMVAYPPLILHMGLDEQAAAVFLGASVHDVAQAVAAGYTLSPQAGETAALVKLMRVALLAPIVALVFMSFSLRGYGASAAKLPVFIYAFAALLTLNSVMSLPSNVAVMASYLSFGGILLAVAAVGLRTNLVDLVRLGAKPIVALTLQSLLLAALALALAYGVGDIQ